MTAEYIVSVNGRFANQWMEIWENGQYTAKNNGKNVRKAHIRQGNDRVFGLA